MGFFRVMLGNKFTILATNGGENGRQLASKSEAVAFDVYDRMIGQMVARDQQFEAAFDFCASRLAMDAAHALQ
ncbi:conserved hypothetical protein [Paraburkholderia unamae]|nr:conserved hypothetical protein [Paraburkholderia unamae]